MKSITRMAFIVIIFGFYINNADADLKKKVMVEPFQNPPNWTESFDPGKTLTEMVVNELKNGENYRLILETNSVSPDDMEGKVVTDAMKPKDEQVLAKEQRPTAQVSVRGRLLAVKSKEVPTGVGKGKKEIIEKHTEIEAEITLVNSKSGKVIAWKKILKEAMREKRRFELMDESPFHGSAFESPMKLLAKDAGEFISQELKALPFEATIVWMDAKKNEVIINAGINDGVHEFDLLTVHLDPSQERDPHTQADLGDQLQVGVIKTEHVQGDFSRAQILAGATLKTGNLVRMKQLYGSAEKTSWRAFHGKLSLP